MRRLVGALTAVFVMALTSVIVVISGPGSGSTALALGTAAVDPSSQVQNIPDSDVCGANNAGRWVKFTLGGSGTGTFDLNSGQPKWDGKYSDTGTASATTANGRQIRVFGVVDQNGNPVTFDGVAAGVGSQNPVWNFTPTTDITLDLLEFTASGGGNNTLKDPAVFNGGNISQIAICGFSNYNVTVKKDANFNSVTPTSTTFPITLTCSAVSGSTDDKVFQFSATVNANGVFQAFLVVNGSVTTTTTVSVPAGFTCTATDSVAGWTTTPGTVTLPESFINNPENPYTVTVKNVRVVPNQTLTVAKTIVGAFPGDATQFTFTVNCSYNGTPIDLNGAAAGNAATLTAPGGTSSLTVRVDAVCSVTESGLNAGTLSQWTTTPGVTQNNIVMDQDRTVSFTNTRNTTTVTAQKIVNYNGTTNPGDDLTSFPVTLTCSNNGQNLTGTGLGTTNLANNGTVAATVPTGASCQVSETLSAADAADWTISYTPTVQPVTVNSPTTLIVTNTRKVGKLTIVKNVVPAGTTVPADLFSFDIACDGTTGDASNVIARPGQDYVSGNIPTGVSCTVTEDDPGSGWIIGGPQTITIAEGQPAGNTVTFTNTKKAGVTLTKNVSGLATGTAWGPFSFTMSGSTFSGAATQTISGTGNGTQFGSVQWTNLVPGDTYTITETLVDGWSVSLDCGVTDTNPAAHIVTFVATAGSSVSCTATNVAQPATLTVNKTTVGGNGTFSFTAAPGVIIPDVTTTSGSGTSGAVNVLPGTTLNVAESTPDSSWIPGNMTCAINPAGPAGQGAFGSPSGIVPGPGDAVTCQITNTKKGKVVVQKTAVGANDTFLFDASWLVSPIQINTAPSGFGEYGSDWLAPGQYTVTERDLGDGWSTSLTCTDGQGNVVDSSVNTTTRTGTANVDPGETVTCSFTNTKKGTIVIQKVTVPASDEQDFTFTQNIDGSGIVTLDTDPGSAGTADTKSFLNVTNGTYTVTEQSLPGWELTALSCVDPTSNSTGVVATGVATINLAPGETVTCTYTNTKLGGVTVSKTALGPVSLVSGNTYRVAYDLVVTNESYLAQTFSLTDAPTFGAGTAITSRSATIQENTTPVLGAPAAFTSAPWVLYSDATIAARDSITVRVTIDFTVAGSTTSSARDCALGEGESGTGTLNTATVTFTGGSDDDDACVTIPDPNIGIVKNFVGLTRNSDGDYKAEYSIVVTNSGTGPGTYQLTSDIVDFPDTVTNDNPVVTGPNPSDSVVSLPSASRSLNSSQSETFTVIVDNIAVTGGVISVDAATCGQVPTKDDGLYNEASITTGGVVKSDDACGNLPVADVQIIKDSPTTDSPAAGTQFTYTLKVKNNGPDTADDVIVTDTVPAPLELVSVNAGSSGFNCIVVGNSVECLRSSLSVADGEQTITLTVSLPASSTSVSPITNTGNVDTTTPETTKTNNTDDDTVTPRVATLTLTKIIDAFGLELSDVTLTATGPTNVSGLASDINGDANVVQPGTYTLSETAPAGFTGSAWTCGAVSVTNSQVVVAPGANVSCEITNTADPATLTFTKTTIGDVGTFTLKADDGENPVTIDVTTVTSGVAVTSDPEDLVPGTSYIIGEVDPGSDWEARDFECTSTLAGEEDSTVIATADLAEGYVPSAGEAIACEVTNYKLGGITVVKDGVGTVTSNGDGTYTAQFTITVENQSFLPQDFSLDEIVNFGDGVTIEEATAEETSNNPEIGEPAPYQGDDPWVLYTDETLPANGSGNNSVTVTLTFIITIDPAMTADERDCDADLENKATFNIAEITFGDGQTAQDPACLDLPEPSISIEKNTVDDGLTREADGTFTAVYKVVLTNNGEGPGQFTLTGEELDFGTGISSDDLVITDETDAVVTLPVGPIALAGGGDTYTFTVTVTGIEISSTFDRNEATCASEDNEGGKGLFNSATAEVRDISISDDACYSLTTLTLNKLIVNDQGGILELDDVTLFATDGEGVDVIEGSDPSADLDQGVSAIVLAGDYTLSESEIPGYEGLDWECSGNASLEGDVVTVPEGEHVVCTITNDDLPVDISIDKDDDGATPAPGEVFEYTLFVSNVGPRALDADEPVFVADTLPSDDLSWVAEGLDPRCEIDGLTLNCELAAADVNDGGVTLTLQVLVALDTELTEWVNQAWVSTEDDSICLPGDVECTPPPCPTTDEGVDTNRGEAISFESNSSNNTDCEPTELTPRPTVNVAKTVIGNADPAGYQFDFTLTGLSGATGGGLRTWNTAATTPSAAWTTGLTPGGTYVLTELAKAGWKQEFNGCTNGESVLSTKVVTNSDGSISVEFTAAAGADITCNFTNTADLVISVETVCVGNVPYLAYGVTLNGKPYTGTVNLKFTKLTGTDLNGNVIAIPPGTNTDAGTLTAQAANGQVLWPGAAVAPDGSAIDWPGWVLVNGDWQRQIDYLTPNLGITVTLTNPPAPIERTEAVFQGDGLTVTATADYPPATSVCYGPVEQEPPATTTTLPPPQLPRTGGDMGQALQIALIALISGLFTVILARRRRTATEG